MALSGAAVTSTMGRKSLGTTNALLAALNVRLGAWVPNPRYVNLAENPDGGAVEAEDTPLYRGRAASLREFVTFAFFGCGSYKNPRRPIVKRSRP